VLKDAEAEDLVRAIHSAARGDAVSGRSVAARMLGWFAVPPSAAQPFENIAVGMEGAPGHQAAGITAPGGPGGSRGEYDFSPSTDSIPGYPPESYRTFGGFDWMTSTVGGLWDSLLAEGKPWWITSNSDSQGVRRPGQEPGRQRHSAPWDAAGHTFDNFGRYGDPVYADGIQTGNSDFWPGYYSRTHVGATSRDHRAVMAGRRRPHLGRAR
jgi:hypothetical protein